MPPQLQSPEIQAFANGFPIALMHIGVTVAILFAGVLIYILLTPHREIALIREGNSAAALSLGGVLVGLAIPLSASLAGSASLARAHARSRGTPARQCRRSPIISAARRGCASPAPMPSPTASNRLRA